MSKEPLMILLANLAEKDGVVPLADHFKDCWERTIGAWKIAFNGHREARPSTLTKNPVDPFHCYVEFNGWPAGMIHPYGGIIAAGTSANEDTFAAAIEAELAS